MFPPLPYFAFCCCCYPDTLEVTVYQFLETILTFYETERSLISTPRFYLTH